MRPNSDPSAEIKSISAAIICYNEADNIARCLDSLTWCDQVVVVDSGSTDNTLEIAERYPNVEIDIRPFDNFMNQRNHSLDLCRNDWVLTIDADEVVTPGLKQEMLSLNDDSIVGYSIPFRVFLGEREIKHGTWSDCCRMRYFRKSLGRWGGANPHERVLLEGPKGTLSNHLLHYSYRDRADIVQRRVKYVGLAVDHMAAKGRQVKLFEPYVHCAGNFLKAYVIKKGFLDGSDGFYIAQTAAYGSFLKYHLLQQRNKQFEEKKCA